MTAIRVHFVLAHAIFFFYSFFSVSPQAQTQTNHNPPISHAPATLEGNWSGSLEAGDGVFHLVLHVSKAENGSFRATIDSLDQGVYGIEVTDFAQNGSDLRFGVASVGALYEGKISADHSGIQGVWSQGNVGLPLAFHRQAPGAGARRPGDAIGSAEGLWQGALEANGLRLRFQLHVTHDDQSSSLPPSTVPIWALAGFLQ